MKLISSILVLVGCKFLIGIFGCTAKPASESNSTEHLPEVSIPKAELSNIYAQAVGDYLRLVKDKCTLNFDTLYFGKFAFGRPEDFPDIELPSTIENSNIRLIAPAEGEKIQKENDSAIFINLIGSADSSSADFIFVTFSHGFAHQFDCHINYEYNPAVKGYKLADSRFEDFLYKKG